jgi:alpha-beta hydrolase superfamily lysophospholipase
MKSGPMKCIVLLFILSSASLSLDTASLRSDLKPIDLSRPPECSTLEREYFTFYGIDFPSFKHWIGTFRSGSYTISCQLFQPALPKGTIVFIHGYCDHTGLLKNIIKESLGRSYAFAAIDLPGHGLSSGKRAAIDDFGQYRDALRDFLRMITPHCQGPIVLAGHSTGCAAVYDYLATCNDTSISRAILAAPLIRSAYWSLGKAGYYLLRPFASEYRRWYRNSSHDTAFLAFQRRDPLSVSVFPIEWSTALYKWEHSVQEYPAIKTPVTIIQGDCDETVDWRYNCGFLKKKCTGCDVQIIKGARHNLINESEPWRSQFLTLFFKVVENPQENDGK